MEVDALGLDDVDRKILMTIIENFGGGPVGIGTISAAIDEDKDTIESIYEPFLMRIGFLERTTARPEADGQGLRAPRLRLSARRRAARPAEEAVQRIAMRVRS